MSDTCPATVRPTVNSSRKLTSLVGAEPRRAHPKPLVCSHRQGHCLAASISRPPAKLGSQGEGLLLVVAVHVQRSETVRDWNGRDRGQRPFCHVGVDRSDNNERLVRTLRTITWSASRFMTRSKGVAAVAGPANFSCNIDLRSLGICALGHPFTRCACLLHRVSHRSTRPRSRRSSAAGNGNADNSRGAGG